MEAEESCTTGQSGQTLTAAPELQEVLPGHTDTL